MKNLKLKLQKYTLSAGLLLSFLLPISLQAIWEPAVVVSDPANFVIAQGPVLSVNPQGNAIAVWTALNIDPFPGTRKVLYSFYTRGIGWTPEALVSNNDATNPTGGPLYPVQNTPDVAMNASNYAVAVWATEYATDNFPQVVVASAFSGGLWGPIEILSDQSGDIFAQSPNVAVNDAGLALAAWREQDTSADPPIEYIAVSFLPQGGAWTPFLRISGPLVAGLDDLKPYPQINAAGNAVVSWKFADGSNSVFGVMAATYNAATNTWSLPVTLDSGQPDITSTPRSDINNNGNAVVNWITGEGGVLKAAYFDGIGWSVLQIASSPVLDGNSPSIIMDQQNVATSLWSTILPDAQVYTSQSIAGGPWSPPVIISVGNDNSTFPSLSQEPLAVDTVGNLIALWIDSAAVVSSYKLLGEDWSAPEQVFQPSDNFLLSIGLADCGFAVALWYNGSLLENPIVMAAVNTNILVPEDGLVQFRRCCSSFVTQKVCTNTLTWEGFGACILRYNIYRNGIFIGSVPGNSPFIFNDPIRCCSSPFATYTISSVNIYGFESAQVPFFP